MNSKVEFDSMMKFCKNYCHFSKIKLIEEVLSIKDSITDNFEEIKTIISQGTDLNSNSKREIQQILSNGVILFGKDKDQMTFNYKIRISNSSLVNRHKLDELFTFAKIKINQESSVEDLSFKEYFHSILSLNKIIQFLNQMITDGLTPEPKLWQDIALKNNEESIFDRVKIIETKLNEWKAYVDNTFQSLEPMEQYFMLMFQGKNLSLLNEKNLIHYLRLFSRKMRVNKLDLDTGSINFHNSDTKLKFLTDLIKRNLKIITENVHTRKTSAKLDQRKINYVSIPQDLTHQFLVYLFSEKFREKLECKNVLFCSEETDWQTIKCKSFFVL